MYYSMEYEKVGYDETYEGPKPRLRSKGLTKDSWTARHNKVLIDTFRGTEADKIALAHNVSTAVVRSIQKQQYFKDRLQALHNDAQRRVLVRSVEQTVNSKAREILEKTQKAAALKIVKLMRKGTSEHKLQFEAAKDILDRTGLKAVEVIETRTRDYSPEEVARAKNTLQEIETSIARLENKDSKFLLVRQTKTLESSSVTDTGSDVPTKEET